ATTFLSGSTYMNLSLMYSMIFKLQIIFSNEDLLTIKVVDLIMETTILDDENDEYKKEWIIQLIQNELKNNSTNNNIIPLNDNLNKEYNIQNI
ncbi:10270_t:CDS:2, partial [Funneliformis geosporum]